MTTDVVRIVSPDLYAPNESLRLDASRVQSLGSAAPQLAAVTYLAAKHSPADDLSTLVDMCRSQVESSLYDNFSEREVMMLVADGPWQPRSALVKKKKLWGRNPWAMDAARFPSLSTEIMVTRESGVRYAGLATLARQGFALAVQMVRKNPACAILARQRTPAASAPSIMEIFSAAFPLIMGIEITAINWTSLALFVCPMGDILVRPSGSFDDPSAAIDLIFDPTRNAAASL